MFLAFCYLCYFLFVYRVNHQGQYFHRHYFFSDRQHKAENEMTFDIICFLFIMSLKDSSIFQALQNPDYAETLQTLTDPLFQECSLSHFPSRKNNSTGHPDLERPLSLGKLIVVFYLIISERSPYTSHLTSSQTLWLRWCTSTMWAAKIAVLGNYSSCVYKFIYRGGEIFQSAEMADERCIRNIKFEIHITAAAAHSICKIKSFFTRNCERILHDGSGAEKY